MDSLKIVKGNTFETIVQVKAYKYNGEEILDFNLSRCTDIKIIAHISGNVRRITDYEILEGNKISIAWPANTTKAGQYSLEVIGKLNGDDWRFYDKTPLFYVVNTNEEAHIPQRSIIKEDCY